MSKQRDGKRSLPFTGTVLAVLILQAAVLIIASLLAADAYFDEGITGIYEEMDRSISSAVYASAEQAEMDLLARKTMAVYASLDDPVSMYQNDRENYLAAFAEIMKLPEYESTRAAINDMRRNTSSSCVSYILMIPEKDIGVFILDASDSNVMPCGEIFELETSGVSDEPGKEFTSFISESEEYGPVYTDGIPCLTDPSQGIYSYLASDIPIRKALARSRTFMVQNTLAILIVSAIICAAAAFCLKKKAVQPLLDITKASDEFVDQYAAADAGSNIFSKVDGGDIRELQKLAETLSGMEQKMNTYLTDVEHLSAEKAKIQTELSLAESIQTDMLPNIFPAYPDREEFEIYASMNPAREVGGDFYDFFLIDEDHLAMVIADVSGKGIPAALFMMMSKIIVKNYTVMGASPAEILSTVNDAICQNNRNDMFVTVWLGILTISAGTIVCANGGHEYPIVKANGKDFELLKDPHGIPLGVMEDQVYRNYEISLGTDDTLFVYSDGLPEASDADKKQFGLERITEELNRDPERDTQTLLHDMTLAVSAFVKDAEPFDDLTMMALRMNKITAAPETNTPLD